MNKEKIGASGPVGTEVKGGGAQRIPLTSSPTAFLTQPSSLSEGRRGILLETTDKIGLSSIVIDSAECDQPFNPENNYSKDFSLEKAERELISRALKETGWQKTRAAALLGITRATLYAKVKQYEIKKGSSPKNDRPQETQDQISAPSSPEYAATS